MLEHSYFYAACSVFILIVFAQKLLGKKRIEKKRNIKKKEKPPGNQAEAQPRAQRPPPPLPQLTGSPRAAHLIFRPSSRPACALLSPPLL